MKRLVLLLGILSLATSAHAASALRYRGYVEVGKVLGERILKDGTALDLGTQTYGKGLLALLGTYDGIVIGDPFRNGDPNPFNLLLWKLVLSDLAGDLATECAGKAPFEGNLSPEFAGRVKALCAWPAPASRAKEVLENFYYGLLWDDVVDDREFEAFREFFQGPAFAQAAPADAISAMTMAALLNPNFLLQRGGEAR